MGFARGNSIAIRFWLRAALSLCTQIFLSCLNFFFFYNDNNFIDK